MIKWFGQGTTIALASLSQLMQIDKVKSVVLLSPVAYLSHITTAITKAAAEVHLDEVCSCCYVRFSKKNNTGYPLDI